MAVVSADTPESLLVAVTAAHIDPMALVAKERQTGNAGMRRVLEGSCQTLTIPAHAEVDPGTLRAIIRQASRYIPENELRPHFWAP